MKHTDYTNIVEAAQKLTGFSGHTKKNAWKALNIWVKEQHRKGLRKKRRYNEIENKMLHWCKPGNGLGPDDTRLISYREAWYKTQHTSRLERGGEKLMKKLGLKTRWENIQLGGSDNWERALIAETRPMVRDKYNALIFDTMQSDIYDQTKSCSERALKKDWLELNTWPLDNARKCAKDVEKFGGDEHGGWQTRCNFDDKGRGEAINVDIYGIDYSQKLYVIQVRQFIRERKSYFPQLRKSYFLIGYNENGNPFAHSLPAATIHAAIKRDPSPESPVRAAQAWIWKVKEGQLPQILRNGDVALIPISKVPQKDIIVESGMKRIIDSHWIYSKEIRVNGATYALNPTLRHLKGQHPTQKGKGWFKVMVADRASFHDFARPTID